MDFLKIIFQITGYIDAKHTFELIQGVPINMGIKKQLDFCIDKRQRVYTVYYKDCTSYNIFKM